MQNEKSNTKSMPQLQKNIYRVLDANLNRVKEGLRVIEEFMRLHEGDTHTMHRMRTMRHALDDVSKKLYHTLLDARDTTTDAGKDIVEKSRNTVYDICIANCKRVQEGLRVLEEFSKVVPHVAASQPRVFKNFKKFRFEMYDIEKRILLKR